MRIENTALYIGRFQPLHIGHLSMIDQMAADEDIGRILIGIGSSQEANTFQNTFSFNERKEMFEVILEKRITKPWEIFGIPDVYNDEKWRQLVNLLSPRPFQIIYTGNEWVSRIWPNGEKEIRKPEKKYQICGTDIRELMLTGDAWQDFVPDAVINVIKKVRGVERISGRGCRPLTPAVTADMILNYQNQGVVLVQRKEKLGDPNSLKWAIPGGHIEYGKETVEQAASRETKEETNLDVEFVLDDQFRLYSDPDRDPRGHYVTMVYHKYVASGELRAGDDAADIRVCSWDEIPDDLAFDHRSFLRDYLIKAITPFRISINQPQLQQYQDTFEGRLI